MKKVKLTQEEENLVKEIIEVTRSTTVMMKKKDKLYADFWYLLTQRKSANYEMDGNTGDVYELSIEEAVSRQKRN